LHTRTLRLGQRRGRATDWLRQPHTQPRCRRLSKYQNTGAVRGVRNSNDYTTRPRPHTRRARRGSRRRSFSAAVVALDPCRPVAYIRLGAAKCHPRRFDVAQRAYRQGLEACAGSVLLDEGGARRQLGEGGLPSSRRRRCPGWSDRGPSTDEAIMAPAPLPPRIRPDPSSESDRDFGPPLDPYTRGDGQAPRATKITGHKSTAVEFSATTRIAGLVPREARGETNRRLWSQRAFGGVLGAL
jgi:hypothetical protein